MTATAHREVVAAFREARGPLCEASPPVRSIPCPRGRYRSARWIPLPVRRPVHRRSGGIRGVKQS